MVSRLLLAKITSSRPAPGTIVPCPTVVLSEAAAAPDPKRMPPVLMVMVWPAPMRRLAAVLAFMRSELIVCVVQAAVFVWVKLTFCATVKVRPLAVAVAGALIVMVFAVVLVDWIEAPTGMPVPLTIAPTTRLATLATVRVAEPLVVEPAVRVWP